MTTSARTAPSGSVTPSGVGEPVISVGGLVKRYGHRTVITDVSFDVADGEIFGILGTNGAGKTTTIEILQGLRERDGGTVRVLGHDPGCDPQAVRALVGSQLQEAALPERLRVKEAVDLFARLAGGVVDGDELVDTWGLRRLARASFGDLSGGERQRLFIALALVNRPKVVFLDELTQGLDPAARRDTWRLIRQVREAGTTVVLVTHFMEEAEHLCDRVAIMDAGTMAVMGRPADLVAAHRGGVVTRFSLPRDQEVPPLKGLAGVSAISREDGRVAVYGDGASVTHVAACLAASGIIPVDLHVERPTLEDVYLTLAGACE